LFTPYSIGHFINKPNSTTAFEILNFKTMQEPEVDDVHKHTFYEIIWTEKGKSIQTIDYKKYKVLPNSLFFISPNQVHQFEEWQPLTGGTILFTESYFLMNHANNNAMLDYSFLDNLYANPCIQFTSKTFEPIKQTINLMQVEYRRADSNTNIIQAYLHILLSQVQRFVDKSSMPFYTKKYLLLFKQYKLLVEQHYTTNNTVSFYAKQLFITQHHLNLVCKNITGKSATQILRDRSILEAKRMLTFTNLSVSQIAAALHYFDSAYFSKIFKQDTQLSPLAFRIKMSEKYKNN
jgi:AraC family transcriptional regulator, transcriptional activator of pobA